jgi:cytochrome c556
MARWMMPALPVLLVVAVDAEEPRTPSIRALMHRQYTVSRAPVKIIKIQLNAQAPDWVKLQEAVERFVSLAETLAKKTPPQGSEESWRTFLDQHMADARAMANAAMQHDLENLRGASQRIAKSCQSCHDAHRFKRGD